MKTCSFRYLIKQGAKNLYVNRMMSLAAIGVLIACLLLIGASLLFSMNVNSVIGYVEDQNELVAFMLDEADDQQLQQAEKQLNDMENVAKVEFVSKEQALEQEREKMGDEAWLLDGFEEENPYPNSFTIQVKDLSELEGTLAQINQISGLDYCAAPTDVASTISGIKHGVALAGIVIVAILAAVSLLIIANTIRLTVFSRRKEINIMKYVGATDVFIRLPFVVEGLLLGVISALVSFGLLWVGYHYLSQWIATNQSSWITMISDNMVSFGDVAWPILGGFLAAGALSGAVGSMVFVRKYLKV